MGMKERISLDLDGWLEVDLLNCYLEIAFLRQNQSSCIYLSPSAVCSEYNSQRFFLHGDLVIPMFIVSLLSSEPKPKAFHDLESLPGSSLFTALIPFS
jgi:hypothetical protein